MLSFDEAVLLRERVNDHNRDREYNTIKVENTRNVPALCIDIVVYQNPSGMGV